MLRAENLGSLGEHRRAAEFGQEIRAVAQCRVGSDAGKGVRTAAVEAEDDLRRWDFGATFRRSLLDEAGDLAARGLHRGTSPTGGLERHADQAIAGGRARSEVMIDLVALAA